MIGTVSYSITRPWIRFGTKFVIWNNYATKLIMYAEVVIRYNKGGCGHCARTSDGGNY